MPKTLVLASASPRRSELLSLAGYSFRVEKSSIEEFREASESPKDYCKRLALEKSNHVASSHPQSYVIGADTIVATSNQVLEKPENAKHAREMLEMLSGGEHLVHTAFAITCIESSISVSKVLSTKVFFRELSSKEVEYYVSTEEPFDKAGAYGIQGFASCFVEKIEGSYSNVVGLPLSELVDELETLGINRF